MSLKTSMRTADRIDPTKSPKSIWIGDSLSARGIAIKRPSANVPQNNEVSRAALVFENSSSSY